MKFLCIEVQKKNYVLINLACHPKDNQVHYLDLKTKEIIMLYNLGTLQYYTSISRTFNSGTIAFNRYCGYTIGWKIHRRHTSITNVDLPFQVLNYE